jgi:ParB/RepB/Spo0J family partition protein
VSTQFSKAANRRLRLADVPRETTAADRLLDNSRQMIRLDLIDDIPRNPRTAMDALALRELADSIAEHGLLQAPVVRRSPQNSDRYLAVLGARRIAAHRLLGRDEIEVIVRRLDDRHAFLASCVENVQRVQLSAREELDMIGVLVDELGSQDAAARSLGKSKTWLSKRKRLLETPALAAAVERGELSLDHAYDVLTHSHDEAEVLAQLEEVRAGQRNQAHTRAHSPRQAHQHSVNAQPAPEDTGDDADQAFNSATSRSRGTTITEQTADNRTDPAAPLPRLSSVDQIPLETLRTARLLAAHGQYASRAEVITVLRADLLALTSD